MGFYDVPTFGPDRSIGYLIRILNRTCQARMEEVLASEDLTGTQWQTLVLLWFGEDMTCAAIARELAHDKGAMTRLLDELERRGLVVRERGVDDRRQFRVTLTHAGRDLTQRSKARVVALWNRLLDDWDPAEVERLIASLQRLRLTMEMPLDLAPLTEDAA